MLHVEGAKSDVLPRLAGRVDMVLKMTHVTCK